MKAYVILNPVAGGHDPQEAREILAHARDNGRWDYDLYETSGEEDLKKIVQDALEADYDMVVACGGDGTVSGVADGLAHTEISLGILPHGTANAVATELGVPDTLPEALDLLLSAHDEINIDAIQNNGRFYLLECSFGIFSASFEDVNREEKDQLGWLAYVRSGIRNWIGLSPIRVSVTVDGQDTHFWGTEVSLFNTGQIGLIDEDLVGDIHIDDGILDLYALQSKSLWDILKVLVYRILGKPQEAPPVRYWRVRDQVEVSTAPRISWQADGDVRGKTPGKFNVARGVIRVIVPPE